MKFKDLIGVPYEEMDCWAVAKEFYKLEFGLSLQDYYQTVPEVRSKAKDIILSCMKDFISVDDRMYGDLILFRVYGIESHIAVYLGNGAMIHTNRGSGCVIENLAKWEKMIVGFYRPKPEAIKQND